MAPKMALFVMLMALLLQLGMVFGCPDLGSLISDEELKKEIDRVMSTYNETSASFDQDPPSNGTHRNAKRWYGVANPTGDEPQSLNAWPRVTNLADGTMPTYIAIRYCYRQRSDYDSLHALLQEGIRLWEPAMRVSSLRILPELLETSLCSETGIRDDVLRIADTTDWDLGKTDCTLGYNIRAPPRSNALRFERHPTTSSPFSANDVVSMAHELGHAIGLAHEHSKPYAQDHVWFFCENLYDYQKTYQTLLGMFGNDPNRAQFALDKACSDGDFALQLRFLAWAFLPLRSKHGQMIGGRAWSNTYDILSIMHYSSYQGSPIGLDDPNNFPHDAVLVGHPNLDDDRATKENAFIVWRGGQEDPALRTISEGDIARVAQLYELPNDEAATSVRSNPTWSATTGAITPENERFAAEKTPAAVVG